MHLEEFCIIVACLLARGTDAKNLNYEKHLQNVVVHPTPTVKTEEVDTPDERPDHDILAVAKHRAMQVIMEKMLIALGGPIFLQENHGAPNNETYPTVTSPLNITTEPCPEIYAKCSSEIFFSSCSPPAKANADLWGQRLNLFFDLPHNLLQSDKLLNATLRIYKNSSLPVSPDANLVVELYVYTKSLTKVNDENYLYSSTIVSNNFTGWISFDTTEVIQSLDLSDHHGFLIKVKEDTGVYWNAPSLIVSMNCTDENRTVVPVPFGVITDQPEQRFPSLTIHTGMLDHYYHSRMEDQENFIDESVQADSEGVGGMGEMEIRDSDWEGRKADFENRRLVEDIPHFASHSKNKKHKYKHQHHRNNKKMDDPQIPDEIYSYDDEESSEPKHQYDLIEEEDQIPVEIARSSRSRLHHYRMKSFRKPVENQVYSGPILVDDLVDPLPSVHTPSEILQHPKDLRTSNAWSSPDNYNEPHQPENKKRPRSKRRHHNQYHQQKENGEFHRSHPHFHSHNSRGRSHRSHSRHMTHDRQVNMNADRHLEITS